MERTVRVQSRVEDAFWAAHFPECEVESVARNIGVERIPRCLVGLGVEHGQLCLVVQHLFEMRHTPADICGVAMKTAANLIMNSARGHGTQVVQYHLKRVFVPGPRPVPQQEIWDNRSRESL